MTNPEVMSAKGLQQPSHLIVGICGKPASHCGILSELDIAHLDMIKYIIPQH